MSCISQLLRSTTPGHPPVEVSMEEVEYLRSLRFSWTKIAEIIGISRRTLYRRLDEWNLPQDIHYSEITDNDLDTLVREVKGEKSNQWGGSSNVTIAH